MTGKDFSSRMHYTTTVPFFLAKRKLNKHKEVNAEEHRHRAEEDREVENGVEPNAFLRPQTIEHRAEPIEDSTKKKKQNPNEIDGKVKRIESPDDRGSENHVKNDGKDFKLLQVDGVQGNPGYAAGPNDSKDQPTPRESGSRDIAEPNKAIRGISSHDRGENEIVIHHPKDLFAFARRQSVIDATHREHKEIPQSPDGAGNDSPNIAKENGLSNQKETANQSQNRAQTMGDGIP